MLTTAISCCPSPPFEPTLNVGGPDFKRCSLLTRECLAFSLARAGLGGIFHLPLPGWEASFLRFAALWLPFDPDCICSDLGETRKAKPKVCFAHEAQPIPAYTSQPLLKTKQFWLTLYSLFPKGGGQIQRDPLN